MSKPACGQSFAGAAGRESTAAIGRTSREVFFTIAFDYVAFRLADQLDGRGRISPIGHDVTGADNAVGRNTEFCRLIEERLRCFEIAVRTAKNNERALDANYAVGAAHSLR